MQVSHVGSIDKGGERETYNRDGERKEIPQQDETEIHEQSPHDISICQSHGQEVARGLHIGDAGIQLSALLSSPSSSLPSLFGREPGFFVIIQVVIRVYEIHLDAFRN